MKSLVGAASGARFATEMTVRDGLNSAMDEEMERDPRCGMNLHTPQHSQTTHPHHLRVPFPPLTSAPRSPPPVSL